MANPVRIKEAIDEIRDQNSFIKRLLVDTLHWDIPDDIEQIDDISYGWTAKDLSADDLEEHLVDGQVYQVQPVFAEQPWGIFILEFKNKDVFTKGRGFRVPLRSVLRGLVPRRRNRKSTLRAWEREHLLFICTHKYQYFRFAYFKAPKEKGHAEPLTMFGWEPGIPARTVCEFNLQHLQWPQDNIPADKWVEMWSQAFDVEKVTKQFYEDYKEAYEYLQKKLKGLPGGAKGEDDRKIFAQTILNRLMFLRFVERKGWLKFNDHSGDAYLNHLYAAGPVGQKSWYNSRLKVLFFEGLGKRDHQKTKIIGDVPYLNGGLFTPCRLDRLVEDIPDSAFKPILGEEGLLYRYNFTVEESTPLDIDVAVDPEMLGKVFEKLVIERKEKGSYYTPRTVVSFMCREALKGYLGGDFASLVDEHDVENISIPQARKLIEKLKEVKVIDPACGSGAYLLGMLQELFALTKALDTLAFTDDQHDAYERKLSIIQNNLYGVDLDAEIFSLDLDESL